MVQSTVVWATCGTIYSRVRYLWYNLQSCGVLVALVKLCDRLVGSLGLHRYYFKLVFFFYLAMVTVEKASLVIHELHEQMKRYNKLL